MVKQIFQANSNHYHLFCSPSLKKFLLGSSYYFKLEVASYGCDRTYIILRQNMKQEFRVV